MSSSTQHPWARCWQARQGDPPDHYVGYVFALTRGQARSLAARSDPGASPPLLPEDFLAPALRRRPDLDGRAPGGTAWWSPFDLPPELLPMRSSLWSGYP